MIIWVRVPNIFQGPFYEAKNSDETNFAFKVFRHCDYFIIRFLSTKGLSLFCFRGSHSKEKPYSAKTVSRILKEIRGAMSL